MGAPAKFLFDDDFAATARAKPATTVPLADHAAALAEAEAAGHRKGIATARTEAAQRTAAAFERMVTGLEALGRSLGAVEARLETEAVEVAVAVARKLAPELIAREPLAEVTALAADCFRQLVSTPHVVVRISSELYDGARERLEALTRVSGFAGRLVILAEPEIAPGDCRIEWADGGVARERAVIEAAIAEAVARYIAGRRGG